MTSPPACAACDLRFSIRSEDGPVVVAAIDLVAGLDQNRRTPPIQRSCSSTMPARRSTPRRCARGLRAGLPPQMQRVREQDATSASRAETVLLVALGVALAGCSLRLHRPAPPAPRCVQGQRLRRAHNGGPRAWTLHVPICSSSSRR